MTYLFQLSLLLLCILTASARTSHKRSYNGYKVFTVNQLETLDDIQTLEELQTEVPIVDFWNSPSLARKTQIMVPPSEVSKVEEYLEEHGLEYNISIRDVQSVMDKTVVRRGRLATMNWKNYQTLNTIYAWLDSLSFQEPKMVQVSSLGKSFENRDIKLVKMSTGGYKRKPVIYIDAGIHAREWIAPATATYMMNQLLKSNKIEDRDLLAEIDWYFVPVLNPDGYVYTHTEDRLWRKTRSTHNGPDCVGVDANRNFDFHWAVNGVKKDDPCALNYPGPFAFSEPEANATANFLYANRGKIRSYITLHSYSQLILTPYGYTDDLPDDIEELKELGERAAKAIEDVHGTEFLVGAPSEILYKNSGSSRDWARGVAEIKYPFTIELPDKGESGFLLPPEEIQPTAEETWEGVKVIARQLLKDYPY